MREDEADREGIRQAQFVHDRHEIRAICAEPMLQHDARARKCCWPERHLEVGLPLCVTHASAHQQPALGLFEILRRTPEHHDVTLPKSRLGVRVAADDTVATHGIHPYRAFVHPEFADR